MSFVPVALILVLGVTFFGGVISYTTEDLDKTDYTNGDQDYLDYWISDITKKVTDFKAIPEMSK